MHASEREILHARSRHPSRVAQGSARCGEESESSSGQRTTALNRLLERYGAAALDFAMAEALDKGAPSVGSIAYLLD